MAQDQSTAGATVLVVDDSELSRSEMMRLLTEDGLVVVGLASPIGATRAILTNAVSVVVIDVLMPGMRGDRLATLFRGNPRLRELGVVLVSGDDGELSRLSSEVSADAVVSKSALHELVPAVRRALRARERQSWRPRSDA